MWENDFWFGAVNPSETCDIHARLPTTVELEYTLKNHSDFIKQMFHGL